MVSKMQKKCVWAEMYQNDGLSWIYPDLGQIYKQITPTFDPEDDGIWSEIDLLEGDPLHRGVAMRNLRFKPFWLKAEGSEWQGLWEKGVQEVEKIRFVTQ